jgi:CBS-domain-containing membrane protein
MYLKQWNRCCAHGVRRLPVTDKQGVLLGIVSSDDVLQLLAIQPSELARIINSRTRKKDRSEAIGRRVLATLDSKLQ